MKTFYLQQEQGSVPFADDGRIFIDDYLHEGCSELKQVQAASWKDAKALLI